MRQGVHFPHDLGLSEVHKEAGDIHHAGYFVHHDEAARSHHGTGFAQCFVIELQIQVFCGETSTHRTAGLNGFELLTVLDAASDVKNNFAQGNAHGHFDQTWLDDVAADRKGLGALGFLSAHAGIPCRAVAE